MSTNIEYCLPDVLPNWPWHRCLSPHYEEAKQQSSSWVRSHTPFDEKGQKAFDACDLNLLASLAYSHRNKEFIRVGCDLMNFFFVYDEHTDVCDEAAAHKIANIVLRAMDHPSAQQTGESHLLGRMIKEFWGRALTLIPPSSRGNAPCISHFSSTMYEYLHAVAEEASDRDNNRIRKVDDYLRLRRATSGGRPTLDLVEFGLELPEDVTEHEVVKEMKDLVVDLIIFVNDVHSYNREQSSSHTHNILIAIMAEQNIPLQSALDDLALRSKAHVDRFVYNRSRLPLIAAQLGWSAEIQNRLEEYIDGIGQWVRGEDDWSFESARYYGTEGTKIKETRRVKVFEKRFNSYVKKEEVVQSVKPQAGSPAFSRMLQNRTARIVLAFMAAASYLFLIL